MEVEADSLTWLTVCELMWLVSVCPAAEKKTSFPDCGATAHVEEDALGAEERPVVKKGFREVFHNITNVSERLSTTAQRACRGLGEAGGGAAAAASQKAVADLLGLLEELQVLLSVLLRQLQLWQMIFDQVDHVTGAV